MSDPVLLAAILFYVAAVATIAAVALVLLLRRSVGLRDGQDRLTEGLVRLVEGQERLAEGQERLTHELREEIARRNGPEVQEDRLVLKELSDHVKALRQTVAFSDQKLQDVRLQLRDLHADLKDRLAQSSFTLRRTLMDHERLIVELLARTHHDGRPLPGHLQRDAAPEVGMPAGSTAVREGQEQAGDPPATALEPYRRSDSRRSEPV